MHVSFPLGIQLNPSTSPQPMRPGLIPFFFSTFSLLPLFTPLSHSTLATLSIPPISRSPSFPWAWVPSPSPSPYSTPSHPSGLNLHFTSLSILLWLPWAQLGPLAIPSHSTRICNLQKDNLFTNIYAMLCIEVMEYLVYKWANQLKIPLASFQPISEPHTLILSHRY